MLKELIEMGYPRHIKFPHEDDAEKDTSYYEASAACSDSLMKAHNAVRESKGEMT